MTTGITRREFLAGAAALPIALRAVAEPPSQRWLLLGTDKGKGIYRATWDETTGVMGPVELAAPTERPAYFATHPRKPVLYAANELNVGDGKVSSFRFDARSGALEAMEQVSSAGSGPCYVSVDQSGQTLFVACYSGGTVSPISLKKDGALTEASGGLDCRHNDACGVPGPVTERQDAAHLHCAVVAPDNKYLLVCNLGEDSIEVIPITPGPVSGEVFGPAERVATRSGSGPRHLVFHPDGKWVFCMHELDCTIDVFSWSKGRLTPMGGSTISTLGPEAPTSGNTGCEIIVSKDGKFVYANTRGENSLTVYRVNPRTGLLTEQQRVQTGGDVTRLIAFDPSRQWLLCMNQGSDSVTVFAHDAKTGKVGDGTPKAKPKLFPADSPMCVSFL